MNIVSKENSEHYLWGGKCDGWHLVKNDQLSVIQECVPSGCSEVKHYHEQAQQFFFILSGTATLELDGVENIVVANHGLHVPAGVVHQLANNHPQELNFLVVSTPPSHGDRVTI